MPSRWPEGIDPDRHDAGDRHAIWCDEHGDLFTSALGCARLYVAFTRNVPLDPEHEREIREEAERLTGLKPQPPDENNDNEEGEDQK